MRGAGIGRGRAGKRTNGALAADGPGRVALVLVRHVRAVNRGVRHLVRVEELQKLLLRAGGDDVGGRGGDVDYRLGCHLGVYTAARVINKRINIKLKQINSEIKFLQYSSFSMMA